MLKIKQIVGLQTALDTKVESASNQGTGNQGIFKQKTGTDLEFYKIGTGDGIVVVSPASDIIKFDLEITNLSVSFSTIANDDLIAVHDTSGGGTKKMARSDFFSGYATLDSPALTGTPTAPTPAEDDNSTAIATTAFVQTEIANFITTGVQYSGVADASQASQATALSPDPGTLANGMMFKVTTAGNGGYFGFQLNTGDFVIYNGSGWNKIDSTDPTVAGTSNRISVSGSTDSGYTVDISSSYVGQTSITTLGTIATGTWNATTIAVTKGGTGLTGISTHSILNSQGSANTLVETNIGTNVFIGRKASNIQTLDDSDARELSKTRGVIDTGLATNGSMTLMTLSQTPRTAADVQLFFNGEKLEYTTHFTVSSTTVTATNTLNEAYGGSTNDGLGFENTDRLQAFYHY